MSRRTHHAAGITWQQNNAIALAMTGPAAPKCCTKYHGKATFEMTIANTGNP